MKQQAVLEGIKVADFSWVGAGPCIGRELAAHGATVVRIESHRRPELLRVSPPFKDGISGIDRSGYWAQYNTNKYGMSLDLSRPEGREVASRLVLWADLIADSMTPGSMAKLGLSYEDCRRLKPDIIYYSTTQMGQTGPYSAFGAYGNVGAGYAGYSEITGWPDRPPVLISNAYPDFVAPWYLCSAIVAALDYRRRTGKGIYFDQSQNEVGVGFWGPAFLDYTVNGRLATRMGNGDPYMAPHGAFPCRGEDEWVGIAVTCDEEWLGLRSVMGDPDWARDPRFADVAGRKQNEDELETLLAAWTRDLRADDLMAFLQWAGVPSGVIRSMEQLYSDPQLKHRDHFVPLKHQVIGFHHYQRPAYRLSKTPSELYMAAPCLGQHNEFVYKDLLGFSDEEVTQFLIGGVITTDHDVPDVLRPKEAK